MSKPNTLQLTLEPKEAYRLFRISNDLADTLEDVLEAHGSYSKEFLKGLKAALRQAQTGKVKKISSLKDLK